MGDLHCQSSASNTYAPKAHLQAEMTIDGIVEGISARIMINSARFMINSASLGTNSARIMINSAKFMIISARIMITSAKFMTISASSAFILRVLEHPPPPATQRARVTEETFTEADKYFVQTSAVL